MNNSIQKFPQILISLVINIFIRDKSENYIVNLGAVSRGLKCDSYEVPGEYKGFPVKNIISGSNTIQHITFSTKTCIESFNERCFSACMSLISIVIPTSLISISKEAFFNCTKLKHVIFQSNSKLRIIGPRAFCSCSIVKISIPKSTLRIQTESFANCKCLEEILFNCESHLEDVGPRAFQNCKNLSRFTFPKSIQRLGTRIFDGCKKISTIYLHRESKIIHIQPFAFDGFDFPLLSADDPIEYIEIKPVSAYDFDDSNIGEYQAILNNDEKRNNKFENIDKSEEDYNDGCEPTKKCELDPEFYDNKLNEFVIETPKGEICKEFTNIIVRKTSEKYVVTSDMNMQEFDMKDVIRRIKVEIKLSHPMILNFVGFTYDGDHVYHIFREKSNEIFPIDENRIKKANVQQKILWLKQLVGFFAFLYSKGLAIDYSFVWCLVNSLCLDKDNNLFVMSLSELEIPNGNPNIRLLSHRHAEIMESLLKDLFDTTITIKIPPNLAHFIMLEKWDFSTYESFIKYLNEMESLNKQSEKECCEIIKEYTQSKQVQNQMCADTYYQSLEGKLILRTYRNNNDKANSKISRVDFPFIIGCWIKGNETNYLMKDVDVVSLTELIQQPIGIWNIDKKEETINNIIDISMKGFCTKWSTDIVLFDVQNNYKFMIYDFNPTENIDIHSIGEIISKIMSDELETSEFWRNLCELCCKNGSKNNMDIQRIKEFIEVKEILL